MLLARGFLYINFLIRYTLKTVKMKGEGVMAQITSKELGALSDLLSMEENMTAKYKQTAASTADGTLKNHYEQLAMRHQRHYDELVSNLK